MPTLQAAQTLNWTRLQGEMEYCMRGHAFMRFACACAASAMAAAMARERSGDVRAHRMRFLGAICDDIPGPELKTQKPALEHSYHTWE